MITTREQATLRASLAVGEIGLRDLATAGVSVIATDELAALDIIYANHKALQERGTELLEEGRAARREARMCRLLIEVVAERLLDAADLAASEPT